MNYRLASVLAPEDLGPTGTKVINIETKKLISRILIRFKTTKASAGMSLPSPANVTKIELVDGSKPLHSLSGYESQALAYYSHPDIVLDHGQHINTLSEVDLYIISFGRTLWDPLLAFDPTQYENPQLRITWDEDLSDTSVSTNEVEVLAYIFDDKMIAPVGFLSATEQYIYTQAAADSYETIGLPEDRVWRQLLVRSYYDGFEPWYNLAEVRFDENTGDKVPFDFTDMEYFYRHMKSEEKLMSLQVALQGRIGTLTHYIPMTDYWSNVVLEGMGSDAGLYHTNVESRGGKIDLTGTAAPNLVGVATGYLPWHTFRFPFGIQDDIEDWWDPRGKKPRLRLRAGTGGANVSNQVVIEELVRY